MTLIKKKIKNKQYGHDLNFFIFFFLLPCSNRSSSISTQKLFQWVAYQLSRSVVSDFVTPWTAARQASLSISTPGVHSDSRPSSLWCHPAISSLVVPFSSCPQSLPASGSLPMNPFFASSGQSIGVSASASVLSMNIQDWFPLRLTGLISLQSFLTIAM